MRTKVILEQIKLYYVQKTAVNKNKHSGELLLCGMEEEERYSGAKIYESV